MRPRRIAPGSPITSAHPNSLLDTAQQIASRFAANPDPQLRMIKDLLTRNATETDLGLVQERETAHLRTCWKTPEHREAVQAFLEKRAPRFRSSAGDAAQGSPR